MECAVAGWLWSLTERCFVRGRTDLERMRALNLFLAEERSQNRKASDERLAGGIQTVAVIAAGGNAAAIAALIGLLQISPGIARSGIAPAAYTFLGGVTLGLVGLLCAHLEPAFRERTPTKLAEPDGAAWQEYAQHHWAMEDMLFQARPSLRSAILWRLSSILRSFGVGLAGVLFCAGLLLSISAATGMEKVLGSAGTKTGTKQDAALTQAIDK